MADRIIRALQRRRSRVFPDTASKLMLLGALVAPGLLRRFMYDRYREYCYR